MTKNVGFINNFFEKVNNDDKLNKFIDSLGFKISYDNNNISVVDQCYWNEDLYCVLIDEVKNFIEFCGNSRSLTICFGEDFIELMVMNFEDEYEISLMVGSTNIKDSAGYNINNIIVNVFSSGRVVLDKFIKIQFCGDFFSYRCDSDSIGKYTRFCEYSAIEFIYHILENDNSGYIKIFFDYAKNYNVYLGELLKDDCKKLKLFLNK